MYERQNTNLQGRRRVVLGLTGLMGVLVTGCSLNDSAHSPASPSQSATQRRVTATPTSKVAQGTTLYVYTEHNAPVQDLAWSPDSISIVSAARPGAAQSPIRVWNALTGAASSIDQTSIGLTQAPLAWSPDGKNIATCSLAIDAVGSQQVFIWDAQTGSSVSTTRSQNDFIAQVIWSSDNSHIAVAGSYGVEIVNPTFGKVMLTYPVPLTSETKQPSMVAAWSPDGHTIASAAAKTGHSLQFWNAKTGQPLHYFLGSSPTVTVWAPDGHTLATGSATYSQSPQVLNVQSGRAILTAQTQLPIPPDAGQTGEGRALPHTISWSPDSTLIAVANNQNQVQIWNIATKSLAYTYREHTAPVMAIAWSPNGSYIASARYDKTVRVWQAV